MGVTSIATFGGLLGIPRMAGRGLGGRRVPAPSSILTPHFEVGPSLPFWLKIFSGEDLLFPPHNSFPCSSCCVRRWPHSSRFIATLFFLPAYGVVLAAAVDVAKLQI